MIYSLMSYDEERDEFFLQGVDNMPERKKQEKLALSYDDIYDDEYETNEDDQDAILDSDEGYEDSEYTSDSMILEMEEDEEN